MSSGITGSPLHALLVVLVVGLFVLYLPSLLARFSSAFDENR